MSVIALGFFDGVHLGHATLLRRARQLADAYGCTACALTFDRAPEQVLFGTKTMLLSTVADRKTLMQSLYGIDELICVPLDRAFLSTSYEAFVRKFLVEQLHARHIVFGFDYRCGKGGEGTPERLAALCEKLAIGCDCMPQLTIDGQKVCSTYIRSLIAKGDMERAAEFLGHVHRMSGEIVAGQKLGRTIGIPTANLAYAPELLLPQAGVYAVRATLAGRRCIGVCNIGARPTVHGRSVTVETWLDGVSGDFYGQLLHLDFYKRLRGERKFDSLQELREEILKNRVQAEAYFTQKRTD